MKIGFDANTFNLTKGGTTVYLLNLLAALIKIDKNSEFKTFSVGRNYTMRKEGLQKKVETLYRELIWQFVIFPKKAEQEGMQVIHSPNHVAPLKSKIPRVVTFHDIYILKNSNAFKTWHADYAKFILPKVINSGISIISVSEFTKSEIVEKFKIPENQITVIPNGVDVNFRVINNSEVLDKFREKYNLPNGFLLYVGAIEPRKNIKILIHALKIVQNEVEIPLVISTPGGWKNKDVIDMINHFQKKNSIINLGYVDSLELPLLYNLATIFIYPSIYEGFGLPVLEAMACGCPVIVANGSALSELVDKAGLLFTPYSPEHLADEIIKVLSSSELHKKLSVKGLERSKLFTWENCAKKTLDVYKKLI